MGEGMSDSERVLAAREAAVILGRLLAAVASGEVEATPLELAHIEGARGALESMAG